jgi:tetratricopeptide (TPR) repeat protein
LVGVLWIPLFVGAGEEGTPDLGASLGTTVTYDMKTPWAVLKVKRLDGPDSFEAWVSSDVPLDGWLLTRKGSPKPLGRKNLNAVYSFHFKAPQKFSDDINLTVFPLVDGSPQPLAVSWSAKASLSEGSDEGQDPWMRWQDDPSRPYNAVVQGLFVSAVKSYRADRLDEAMKALDKALTLDPTQPQVLDLREKMLEGAGSPTRRTELREAKTLLKKGDPKGAMRKADALLVLDAKDEEAAEIKKKAEAVLEGDEPKRVRPARRTHQKSPTPSEDPEAHGRADQAYNLGLESYRKGNREGAKSFWEQALQNDPHHLQARRALERLEAEQPKSR